jgi:hypothetical protein
MVLTVVDRRRGRLLIGSAGWVPVTVIEGGSARTVMLIDARYGGHAAGEPARTAPLLKAPESLIR